MQKVLSITPCYHHIKCIHNCKFISLDYTEAQRLPPLGRRPKMYQISHWLVKFVGIFCEYAQEITVVRSLFSA